MSKLYKKINSNIKQLVLYGVIGALSAGVDFAIFNVLTIYAGLYYLTANCLSVMIGIFTSFTLNRTVNFKVTDKVAVRFGLFFVIGMFGLALSNAILWVGIDTYHFSETLTKLVSIFVVAFIQFLFNKFITFKQTK